MGAVHKGGELVDHEPEGWGALPPGFTSRPARLEDAAAAAEIITAEQQRLPGGAETTADQVLTDWGGADLLQDSVVVEEAGGRLVALGDCLASRSELLMVWGHVHPEFHGRGLGSFLVRFFEVRASMMGGGDTSGGLSAGSAVRVRHYLAEGNEEARLLLQGRDYELVRAVLGMERRLAAPPPVPTWPPGIRVRAYRGEADEPAVYEAFELGSSGMWGRPGNDLEQWLPLALSREKELFRLALAGGEIVGLAISTPPSRDDEQRVGHLASLRVVPAWRRRGLGAALIRDSLALLHARGARTVSLTVDSDSPSGAPRLYRAAGFGVTRRYLVYEKQVRGWSPERVA